MEKELSLKDATVESAWKKLFFATPKIEDKWYVKNDNFYKPKNKRFKKSDDENSNESRTDSDFFQFTNENSPEDEYPSTDFQKNQFTELSTIKKEELIYKKEENESNDDDDDYEKLKVDYYQQLNEMKRKNKLFIYTEGENFEETTTMISSVLNKTTDFVDKNLNILVTKTTSLKTSNFDKNDENFLIQSKSWKIKKPINCTKVESFLIGPKTLECLSNAFKNVKNPLDLKNAFKRTWNVTKIWIILYISVAIACWCQKGI